MPNAATSNPPMTETIDSASAAASTLFLGHSGEFWDFWLIASVVVAALAAIAIGVTTTGSIVSHKREAATAEDALDRFKLETEKKISESNARTKEAELKLAEVREKLGRPRRLDDQKFTARIANVPRLPVRVSAASDEPDSHWLSFSISGALRSAGWEESWSPETDENLKRCAGPFGGVAILTRSLPKEIDSADSFVNLLQDRHSTSVPGVAFADALNAALGNDENSARFVTCPFIEEGRLHIVVMPRWVILPPDSSASAPTTGAEIPTHN
jgi:hypothetical protein